MNYATIQTLDELPIAGSNADMSSTDQAYKELIREIREISLLGSIGSVLGWDERTQLPPKGTDHRGNQLAMLAGLIHRRLTADKIGDLLKAAEGSGDPESDSAVNIFHIRRSFDRAKKLPESLVEELTKTAVMAQQAWANARQKADFSAFSPWLEKLVQLKKQEAECIGYTKHAYDALLDEFEPGDTTADLKLVFEQLRDPLIDLIGRIKESKRVAPAEILERHYPAAAQEKFARKAAAAIGFDFEAGRLDVSVHPFCSGFGPGDTRMTTRYNESYFGDAFFGVLHETGHGLYEQGLPAEHFGTPRGDSISLGIHESQSRMWENLVGRSRSFWKYFLPKAKPIFGDALGNVSEDDWYRAINDIRPSFIRVESDEATYNLHILLRFELEQAMLTGDLKVKDLPAAWNEKMQKYLGLTPPNDREGVLQDIHWSGGAIGYFPTYTLGNLYAAQFFEQVRVDIGDIDAQFAKGEFQPLLGWLRKNIHSHGKRYMARKLVKKVTGKDLSAEPLLRHLKKKAMEVYGV